MIKRSGASLASVDHIVQSILTLRGQRVILDRELAVIYGVSTKRLNEQVRRNRKRFPEDFVFRLTREEAAATKIIRAKGKVAHGSVRRRPYAFTEHGAIQAANVLRSQHAVAMGVHVARAFLRIREMLASNEHLVRRLGELEMRITKRLGIHDQAIANILSATRELLGQPSPKRRGIGFTADLSELS